MGNILYTLLHCKTSTALLKLNLNRANVFMHVNIKIFRTTLYLTRIIKNLKVSRDQSSFTATKSKETRNKILAQENTKV